MSSSYLNLVFSRSCDGDHTALQRWYNDHIGILWQCDSLQRATLYRRDADGILIEGHWAKPNPQAGHAGPATLLVNGPHAYVSPGWYPDKVAQARVPTWNYAAAELRGVLEPVTDPDALVAMLDALSTHYEGTVGGDWDLLPIEPRQRRMAGNQFMFSAAL